MPTKIYVTPKHDLCISTWYKTVFSLGKRGLVSVANFPTSKPINTIGIAAEKLDAGTNSIFFLQFFPNNLIMF